MLSDQKVEGSAIMPEEPTKQQESTSVHKTGQVSSGLIDASFCNFYV